MSWHEPRYPLWLRCWLLSKYSSERHFVTWTAVRWWQSHLSHFELTEDNIPLPWYIAPGAIGPFLKPWRKLAGWFIGHTGGRTHRCEFTDPQMGALFGHRNGAFMDSYFAVLIDRISLL